MTVTSLVRCRVPALLVLCFILAAVFLAACDASQPTPERTAQPSIQPTPERTAQPSIQPTPERTAQPSSQPTPERTAQPSSQPTLERTAQPSSQPTLERTAGSDEGEEVHGHGRSPSWYVAPSLEEQVYDALDSDSMVVVRASLLSLTAIAETVPDAGEGAAATYRAVHELLFTVHEYLEGSGPNEIMVVVRGYRTFETEGFALDNADYIKETRNSSWDDRQAVLFVNLGQTTSEAAEDSSAPTSSSTRTASFVRSNYVESPWDYTVDNLSRVWLPDRAAAGGLEFITNGAQTPPPTISLADLKAKISSLKTELAEGASIAGFKDCVRGRIEHERVYRAQPGGVLEFSKALVSGAAAGTEVYSRENNHGEPKYNRYWLGGPDAGLFQALNVDDDSSSANGYTYMLSTTRPLPTGTYRVRYIPQHYRDIPCNFKQDIAYLDWTVTATAPTGTVHEAFFDPVAIGSAVGADASNGSLKPKAFTVGSTSTSLNSLKWQSGTVTLTLDTHVSLSGQALDVIALDGTGALSLDGGAATVSGGTLTWNVATQPWKAGDKLMLRLRDATAAAPPTPAAASGS